jgi:hypothetical protein
MAPSLTRSQENNINNEKYQTNYFYNTSIY